MEKLDQGRFKSGALVAMNDLIGIARSSDLECSGLVTSDEINATCKGKTNTGADIRIEVRTDLKSLREGKGFKSHFDVKLKP